MPDPRERLIAVWQLAYSGERALVIGRTLGQLRHVAGLLSAAVSGR